MHYICITIEQNIRKMGKIIELNKNINLPEKDRLRRIEVENAQEDLDQKKRENSQKAKIHELDVRDRNTNNIFRIINQSILSLSKITALIFTIFLVGVVIHNYVNHIPIQNELKAGIPIFAVFTTNIPNSIINFFKKSPP